MATKLTTLDNGLRIVSEDLAHVRTTAVTVSVGVGGRDEADSEHGISHLLEHMAFKGTKRRNAREIAEAIDNIGGDLNAATASEQTNYYVKVLGEDVETGLDVLSDILTEPVFDPLELTKEQNVIEQEIGAAEDTPDDVIFDHFSVAAFPDQTLGRSILGTPETVRSFTPERLADFMGRHYRSDRMVIAAAGQVDHDRLVERVGTLFAPLSGAAKAAPRTARYGGGITVHGRDLEQSHAVIGFPGISYHHSDLYALGMFTAILGGGMSSRLFQEAREERGLCYSIYAFHWPFSDTGLFGISAGTAPKDLPDLVQLALDTLADTAATASEVELTRARAQMKVGLLGTLENSGARSEQLGRQVALFGRPLPMADITARIEAVTLDDVRRIGQSLFQRQPITFAALGPKRGLERAAALAQSFGA